MEQNKEGRWESKYWHPAVAVDAVVFGFNGRELLLLLIQRGIEPYKGCWALPGGFITQDDKSAKDAVLRELSEETTVKGVDPIEFGTFSDERRDPRERVISIAFFALVNQYEYSSVKGCDDACNAQWYKLSELPELAFDHRKIIDAALQSMQLRIHFEPIAFKLLGEEFTLSQLQNIYKVVLMLPDNTSGANDIRNFKKKMLAQGYIKDTGRKLTGTPYRAPVLYSFNKEEYMSRKATAMSLEF